MSLRCSLLGHEYSDSEIEREREERGTEVVISVTELERCVRCNQTRTITENTEVTQRSSRSPRSRPAGDRERGPEPEFESESAPGAESVSGSGFDSGADGQTRPEADADGVAADNDAGVDRDDGEILDADDADADTGREDGAWPDLDDHGDGGSDEPGTWPSTAADDERFDASTPGEAMGEGDAELDGLTPRATDRGAEIIEGTDETAAADADAGSGTDTEFVRAGRSSVPERPPDSGVETELHCPNCDVAGFDERESLRAGDICPECQRGYLDERVR